MSLVVCIKTAEGIVLASDSRVTLTESSGRPSTFDNATKLLTLEEPHNWFGALTYGSATIRGRTPHSWMPEFKTTLPPNRITTYEYAQQLSQFLLSKQIASVPTGGQTNFIVAGHDDGALLGSVYRFSIWGQSVSNIQESQVGGFGSSWGGQDQFVQRILRGYEPSVLNGLVGDGTFTAEEIQRLKDSLDRNLYRINEHALPLQDCVDQAIFLIRTTITAQSLTSSERGVGGPIYVGTITQADGFRWIQKKEVRGERSYHAIER